ncbi:C-C motif chemokine 21-like [Brachyistius frenatus]|uniref:C-C motif chemokine 21-like n=1 Tax=Brachyistius frenatus TaxID=100188 RepID=UPI0037E8CA77
MASRAAALLLLGVVCFQFTAAEIVMDCCLKTSDKRLPSKILLSYSLQEAGKGCDISATVFVSRGGKTMCVVHPSEKPWVQRLITILDQQKK